MSFLYYSLIFVLFFLLLFLSKEKRGLRLFDENGIVSNLQMLLILHIAGIILFGITPAIFNNQYSFQLYKSNTLGGPATWMTVCLFLLILFISPKIAEKRYRVFLANSPIYKSTSIKFLIAYFSIRIFFICSYESWFRGYLLNVCLINFGVVYAIFINVCLYALLHIVNGKDEVIACFPFGLLLCCLCIWQGAAWPAMLLHLALTIPYELNFLKRMKTHQSQVYENINNRGQRVPR